ncbi:EthD domain-containing protein [Candidatus Cyanaurora vandensis]|uniref:EthD domain-containing protein n=1 Tax=Candidatus Cyanaurora vandensis TaxID=2714958 RepID=UPI00257C8341|nr:EthD domain-containing protein [Candidatus Cyanaurora vandensis]
MIKYVYCIRKRADLTDEEFHTYWREDHAMLIRGLAQALRAKKYVQSHKLATPLNEQFIKARGFDAPPYDGVTELWWDSMADFLANFNTPEGMEAAKQYTADEAKFIDFSQSRAFLTEEYVVFDFTEPT